MSIKIEISGRAAKIPALKNDKRIVKNGMITGKETKAVLECLDKLYSDGLKRAKVEGSISFGDQEVFVLAVLGNRCNRLDSDNCLATIRDWLEPHIKASRNRGWGINLIDNDRQVTGMAIRASTFGIITDKTTIYVTRLVDKESLLSKFVNQVIGA
jgi:hypothetical protein